ncbi:MAG: class I SAM-dependent methyltransferase [Erysipelotrichaceae bacterium]|nr:class I SAM-dependent methyltransferase [Erysipelotrichaceae bacterium]
MKPDYKNWVPLSMIFELFAGSAALFILSFLFQKGIIALSFDEKMISSSASFVLGLFLLGFAIWMLVLHRVFDYDGKRKMSRGIIEGIAEHVIIPENGKGLDVGCGSGALTIACAKRNPLAVMTGCDIWTGAYKGVYGKKLCEDNAAAEHTANTCFLEGNAVKLPFDDESFDAVTSNYVYHNIAGKNKQDLLRETLRVVKKGGTFAIHDLMSRQRYGDMQAFVEKLKSEGYEDVRLIDTASGMFMSRKEALWLGLSGSTLLVGKK